MHSRVRVRYQSAVHDEPCRGSPGRPNGPRRRTGPKQSACSTLCRGRRGVVAACSFLPDELARVNPGTQKSERAIAPGRVGLYRGNVLKTPHIALLCLDVMDALRVDYEVMGGSSHCCGVYQFIAGDAAGRAGLPIRPSESWPLPKQSGCCPGARAVRSSSVKSRCRLTPDRTGSPRSSSRRSSNILQRASTSCWPMMTRPVNKRVALNERPTYPGVTERRESVARRHSGTGIGRAGCHPRRRHVQQPVGSTSVRATSCAIRNSAPPPMRGYDAGDSLPRLPPRNLPVRAGWNLKS